MEEILYESHMEQLEKENVNLKRKIQMLETQLIKMQNLKTMNKEIIQKNVDNMKKNEELIMEEKTQRSWFRQDHKTISWMHLPELILAQSCMKRS